MEDHSPTEVTRPDSPPEEVPAKESILASIDALRVTEQDAQLLLNILWLRQQAIILYVSEKIAAQTHDDVVAYDQMLFQAFNQEQVFFQQLHPQIATWLTEIFENFLSQTDGFSWSSFKLLFAAREELATLYKEVPHKRTLLARSLALIRTLT